MTGASGGICERRLSQPAEDVGIAAQLIERPKFGIVLAKIDQEVAARCHDTDGLSRERGRQSRESMARWNCGTNGCSSGA